MQLPGLQETSLKHSPGRHFTNKGPENFTISVRKGKSQQPHKQQPVIAEACAQGKAWRSSAGFRSLSFTLQQGQLWTRRAKATAAAIAPHAATALPPPLAGPAGGQQGKPAQNPALEQEI